MLHRRKALLRAALPTAALALVLTGCGSDGSDDTADAEPSAQEKNKEAAGAEEAEDEAPSGPLTVGQKAPGTHEFDMSSGKAQLEITAEKVGTGKNADLTAAGLQESDVKGQYPVFVHFTYTVKSGSGLKEPDFNLKARVLGEDDKPGKKLMAIGADPIKGGCPEERDDDFEVGDTKTLCSTFLLDEGTDVAQVAWAGDVRDPLLWNVE